MSMSVFSKSKYATALTVLVAIAAGRYLTHRRASSDGTAGYLPWHQGPLWDRVLSIYDEMATELFGEGTGCSSSIIATSFGPTQVHACGDPSHHPVLFLHGASSNSLMFGDWLIPPAVAAGRYAIAADFVCDCGRSAPLQGNPENCPGDREGLAVWVEELLRGMGVADRSVSVVGYSYGSAIAAYTALYRPKLVDRLVLIAPAAVYAPIEFGWLWRAIVYGIFKTPRLYNWFFKYMSADPKFDMSDMSDRDQNLTFAIGELGATVLAVQVDRLEDDVLKDMASQRPTLLLIGQEETVTNVVVATETAKRTGSLTKVYPNAGHLLLMESPRDEVKNDVASFLSGQWS